MSRSKEELIEDLTELVESLNAVAARSRRIGTTIIIARYDTREKNRGIRLSKFAERAQSAATTALMLISDLRGPLRKDPDDGEAQPGPTPEQEAAAPRDQP